MLQMFGTLLIKSLKILLFCGEPQKYNSKLVGIDVLITSCEFIFLSEVKYKWNLSINSSKGVNSSNSFVDLNLSYSMV